MKVINSPSISAFGGINYVIKELDKFGIGDALNSQLPALAPQSKYSWRDILYSYWSIFLCGGDCAEDLGGNFRTSLSQTPHLAIPSPDRVLERMKGLAFEPTLYDSKRSKAVHHFALNSRLNELNLSICKKLFGLSLQDVTVDYDNTICHTEKKDAARTYKHENGYQPGVALIESKVVYVENRNGNSPAHVGQAHTLKRMFLQLQKQNIKVERFRADSATYGLEMIQVIEEFADTFYVRARMNQTLEKAISRISDWRSVENNGEDIYRGETTYTPFQRVVRGTSKSKSLKTYRLIVTKEKRRDGQMNFFTGEACLYTAIITNDHDLSINEVVQFYNQRGAAEKEFDVLKNDFG